METLGPGLRTVKKSLWPFSPCGAAFIDHPRAGLLPSLKVSAACSSRGSISGSLSAASETLSQVRSSWQPTYLVKHREGRSCFSPQERGAGAAPPVVPGARSRELSSPQGLRTEEQVHNCWKRKGKRRTSWTGSHFSSLLKLGSEADGRLQGHVTGVGRQWRSCNRSRLCLMPGLWVTA